MRRRSRCAAGRIERVVAALRELDPGLKGGARLLVADDNKVDRLLLSRSLELQGHRVASAENGRVALEMLRREAFDLLLLDMEMPEMTGFQVLEQMAADAQLRDLPVIVTCSLEGVAHVARPIELVPTLPARAGEPSAFARAHQLQPGRSACVTSRRSWCGASPRAKWRRTCSNRALRWAEARCTAR